MPIQCQFANPLPISQSQTNWPIQCQYWWLHPPGNPPPPPPPPPPIQCHKDHTKITKTAIIKKWIDTGLARIGTTSCKSFTNRRTIVHLIFELVYYRDRLLVSAEDDYAPPPPPCRACPLQSNANPRLEENHCKSDANPLPILSRWNTNLAQSYANPVQIYRQSMAIKGMAIWCQCIPIPVQTKSQVTSVPIHFNPTRECQINADPIHCKLTEKWLKMTNP